MPTITLDHGAGGASTARLVASAVIDRLGDTFTGLLHDSSTVSIGAENMALTTDLFTVTPLFFSNGDIGKLAVCGTVNDLAVAGSRPLYLTLSLLMEEGLEIELLERVIDSVREASREAGVRIVCGDTKVMPRGHVDGLVISASGLGAYDQWYQPWSPELISEGDAVIVTGPVGNHTVNLLSLREGLGFDSKVKSDCAPLNGMLNMVRGAVCGAIHCARDATRGGVATVLAEISAALNISIDVEESLIPVQHETLMACDMLGLDPVYLANEGCACLFVDATYAEEVQKVLNQHPYGIFAARCGHVRGSGQQLVRIRRRTGRVELLQALQGMPLARLC